MANQNPIGSATGTLSNGSQNTTYTLYDSTLLQGFSDPDGDTLKIAGFWADSGELMDLGNGQWSFVPETDYSGAVVFDYVLFDSKGGEIQGTLNLNIVAPQIAQTVSVNTISTYYGTSVSDVMFGTFGNDTLAGLGGYDTLDGGAGTDTALFAGNFSDYVISISGNGYTVQDVNLYDGNEGMDQLSNIELLKFSDSAVRFDYTSSKWVPIIINNPPLGSVLINGTPIQGQVLTATNSLNDLDGLGTIGYQWLRNDNLISDATVSNYTLTASDVDKAISVQASYTDLKGTAESVTSSSVTVAAPINYPPTGNVSISGTAQQNQTLTATNTLADLNGLGAISYSWLINGAVVSNQSSYVLMQNDVGKNVSVTASYMDGLDKLESVSSTSILVQPAPPTYALSVDRVDVNEGESVYFNIATTNIPTESNINFPLTFSGSISSADVDNEMLLPRSLWIGKDGIGTIAVTFSNDKLTEGNEKLVATLINDVSKTVTVNVNDSSVNNNLPSGKLTIIGDAKVGQNLTVQNTLNDADGLGALTYQWLKNSAEISGATEPNYTLTKADLGKAISVTGNYTDGQKNAESVTSEATDLVTLAAPTYQLSANKTELNEGETVTFKLETTNLSKGSEVKFNLNDTIADGDIVGGLPTPSFVVDANGKASLSLAFVNDKTTEGNENLTLTLADDREQTVSVTVLDTSIEPIVNHKPTGSVVIQGTAKVGATLSLSNTLDDADGLGAFRYQWLSNGAVIKNATKETYNPTKTDVGKKISVKVSYTDNLKNAEFKISGETAAIANGIVNKQGDARPNKLIGEEQNDLLWGMAGADTLLGNAGDDQLDGGTGNDALEGGNGNDKLTGGEGNDTLISGSGNDSLDGGKGDDKLTGDTGNDTLNGGVGADKLDGGAGNDYYVVDNLKDTVTEIDKNLKLGGNDSIETVLSYTLGKNFENLILTGITDNNGTGNELNNQITGNVGDNVLKGMVGNDKLVGGNGADTLDGGLGMDTLIGGANDDTYYMNNTEDKIIETTNGGEDKIIASVSFELNISPNVEMLILSGANAINGTGDELDNLLQEIDGGKVANVFDGQAGDDTINGEGGNDTLDGGDGNDILDGGDGIDMAIFAGIEKDYQITRNVDADNVDQILIEYVGNDDSIHDGTDSLTNIETLQFAEGEIINMREETVSSAALMLTGVII